MGEPMGLKSVKTLEVEQRLHQPQARRIAIDHRHHVRPKRYADRAVAGNHVLVGLTNQCAGRVTMVEPFSDAVNDGVLQRVVIENSRHQERGERGVATRRLLRLDTDPREQRIVAAEPQHLRRRTLRPDNLLYDEPAAHVTTVGPLREAGANRTAPWEVLRRPRIPPVRYRRVRSPPQPLRGSPTICLRRNRSSTGRPTRGQRSATPTETRTRNQSLRPVASVLTIERVM